MSNLIITIIAIALLAVVAIAAILYVNTSMDSSQAQAWANAMISQNQQLIAAGNAYSLDHGGGDFSSFGVSDLINNNYLSSWPDFVMFPPSPAGGSGNIATGLYDQTPQLPGQPNDCNGGVSGYKGYMTRSACISNGVNVLYFRLKLNDPYDGTCSDTTTGNGYGFEDARYANQPYAALARAVNKMTGAIPASSPMAASGLPYLPTGAVGGQSCKGKAGTVSTLYQDASGNLLLNYCYLVGSSPTTQIGAIQCIFSN